MSSFSSFVVLVCSVNLGFALSACLGPLGPLLSVQKACADLLNSSTIVDRKQNQQYFLKVILSRCCRIDHFVLKSFQSYSLIPCCLIDLMKLSDVSRALLSCSQSLQICG